MQHIVPKHPRAIRWMHWINFPVLVGMIWSGLLIYWANDVYRLGFGDFSIKLFPDWFYGGIRFSEKFSLLGLSGKLAIGLYCHFTLMWLFAINGVLYVGYTIVSGEWRHLVPNRQSFREAWQVLLHDLHLSKVQPPPRKFNGAQQFAYTGVVLMGAASLLTGLAIYKPTQLDWLVSLLGGYQTARWEHFLLTIGYALFFVVHVAQVIRAGWNNFRAMVTGYEVVHEEEAHA